MHCKISAVALLALLFPAAAAATSPTATDCVGTIAGLPLHAVTDGAAALNAAIAAVYPAVAIPGTVDNVVIPGVVSAERVDGSSTLSVMAGGGSDGTSTSALATSVSLISRSVMASSTPDTLVFGDVATLRRYNLTTGMLDVVAGIPGVYYLNSPDGVPAAGSPMIPVTLSVDPSTGDLLFSDLLAATLDPATGQFGQLLRRASRAWGSNPRQVTPSHISLPPAVIPASGPYAGRVITVAGNGSFTHSTDGALALLTGYAGMYDAVSTVHAI